MEFLKHFVRWEEAGETLQFAAALAIVVAARVASQWNNRRTKEFEKTHRPDAQERAKSELFDGQEERATRPDETRTPPSPPELET